MSILNLGTFPPKQCGIATFSMDLSHSLELNGNEVKIMSVSDADYKYDYGPNVIFNLQQNQKQDYVKAAAFINANPQIDLLIIQHEYGIYGGQDGDYVLELVKRLHKPYILVTHTVLPHPSKHQKQVLNYICHRAAGIVCMTRKSADLLINLYESPPELINIIAHGVPDFAVQSRPYLKEKHSLVGRNVISTFGLIGPGKGLELGIRALAEVAKEYPQVVYMILGQTHPMLRKYEGEKYRQMLEELVCECNLEPYTQFVNRFLTDAELGEYLYMTDIYLSPYPNKDQAVSGTLSFAMGCGCAIVSTSYAYASEVLSGGRGLLAANPDPGEIADLIKKILADDILKTNLEKSAMEIGQTWSWRNVGSQYTQMFARILNDSLLREENTLSYAKL